MIFSRSKRSSKDDENITTNATILAPQSSLSTKGALKIVDKWVTQPSADISEQTPGPGAYNINDSLKPKNKGLKFSTKTIESRIKRENDTPGPGAYASDNTTTLIKKSFNTYHHLPLYKLNNDENSNDTLKPTRVQGIKNIDTIKENDVNVSKLKTRKEIKDAMLSLRSLATTGEIDDMMN